MTGARGYGASPPARKPPREQWGANAGPSVRVPWYGSGMTLRLLLVVASIVWVGCSSSDDAPAVDAALGDAGPMPDRGTPAGGTVAGGIIYHSVNRRATEMSGTTPEYSQIEVAIHSHAALLADADAAPLGTVPIPAGCTASGMCAFSVPAVDLAAASGGLVVGLRDLRATPIWAPSWTNTAGADALAAAVAAGSLADARSFVVSQEGFDLVLAPMTTIAANELLARGVIFGLVYDEAGRPVMGATVAAAGRSDLTIVYPNGTFDGVAAATATQGAFMAVPAAGAPATAEVSFTVTPPAGSALTWTTDQPALLARGVLSFTLLYGE
jgi:hypothetical protein